jgi:hypothetical protein
MKKRHEARKRGSPSWLSDKELDEMARRRCLMVLSVLSGEKSVSEVVTEAKIARQTYYQIEERGLRAMLAALLPAMTESGGPTTPEQKLAYLEKRVKVLEQDKRRLERLLLLTRKVIKPGRVALAVGRPRKRRAPRPSTKPGSKPSRSSKTTSSEARSTSTPTTDGGAAR